jgi:hypothetical protein
MFFECRELCSLRFEFELRLSRIKKSAFSAAGLTEIGIPSSVEVLGERSFFVFKSLLFIRFESGSRLSKIGDGAFL